MARVRGAHARRALYTLRCAQATPAGARGARTRRAPHALRRAGEATTHTRSACSRRALQSARYGARGRLRRARARARATDAIRALACAGGDGARVQGALAAGE
eukprot:3347041-Pleurochrysis_carterae.AAC.1